MAAIAVFLLTWVGLTAVWHWSRGDALGLATVPFSAVLAALGWWAGLSLKSGGKKQSEEAGPPDATADRDLIDSPVRFGAIPAVLTVTVPREELLARLRDGSATKVTIVFAVTGLRGVGKTQLAAEYARDRIAAGWALVAWIDAEEPVQMLGQLVSLAERLHLRQTEDEDAAKVTARLRDWLQARTEPGLLVFDNAIDADVVADYLPATGATHIVITSTAQTFTSFGEAIHVPEFSHQQATGFFRRSTGFEDEQGAASVAEELGRLPLALAHAAAVIAEQHLDYPTYLQRLRSMPLTDYLPRPEGHPYPRGVSGAILLSLTAVENSDPTGTCRSLVDLLAVLAPTGTRRELLYEAFDADGRDHGQARQDPRFEATFHSRPEAGTGLASVVAFRLDEAIARLARASLVTRSQSGRTVTSHRLVMRVVRERCQAQQRLAFTIRIATGVLNQSLTVAGEDAWLNRTTITELVSHTTALWEQVCRYLSTGPDRDLVSQLLGLRINGLSYLLEVRDAARAIALGEDLADTCRRELGECSPDTMRSRNSLAVAYREAGHLAEAISMFEQTLADREQVLGPDHPDTLQSRNDLAIAYRQAGQLAEAIIMLKQTLGDREQVLGPDHPDTLQSRNDLAYTYRRAGGSSDVTAMHELALAAREQALGPDHPGILQSRNNLASVYREAGRLTEAIGIYEQTLTDRERVLGPDHPDTLQSRNNLGFAYRQSGRLTEAIGIYEQTLTDRERVLGPDHPDTLQSRNNLAFAYRQAGRPDEAISMYQRTLADRERLLGPDHPDTLRSRSNLAVAFREAGRAGEAISMLKQTLAARERLLGPDHPDTLRSLYELAIAYRKAGQVGEAISAQQRAFAARERLLGPEHPDTVNSRADLTLARKEAESQGGGNIRSSPAWATRVRNLVTRTRVAQSRRGDTARVRQDDAGNDHKL